jgi:Polyketide cyclase / dehydrase and lipid transport
MRQFQRKERIATSIHRVWAILVDLERWPEWNASVNRIAELNSRPLGLGSRVRIHQPKLRPAVWVVTAWVPESRFVWEAAGPGLMSSRPAKEAAKSHSICALMDGSAPWRAFSKFGLPSAIYDVRPKASKRDRRAPCKPTRQAEADN